MGVVVLQYGCLLTITDEVCLDLNSAPLGIRLAVFQGARVRLFGHANGCVLIFNDGVEQHAGGCGMGSGTAGYSEIQRSAIQSSTRKQILAARRPDVLLGGMVFYDLWFHPFRSVSTQSAGRHSPIQSSLHSYLLHLTHVAPCRRRSPLLSGHNP